MINQYKTKKQAERARKMQPYPHKHKVVKTSYFNLRLFTDKPCWTIVYKYGGAR